MVNALQYADPSAQDTACPRMPLHNPHVLRILQLLAYYLATVCLAYPWLNPLHLGPSVTVFSGLVAWWGAAGLALCFVTLLTRREARWRVLLIGWALAAGVSAVMGLLQYFDKTQDFWPWINYAGLGQAFGNLRQRNQFATLCSIGLVVMWWWAQYAQAGWAGGLRAWQRTALLITLAGAAALVCAASAASSSRTGFLQLMLLCLLAWWWRGSANETYLRFRGLQLVGLMVLVYILAAIWLPIAVGADGSVFERMRESPDGCTSRVALYRNVLYLITQKPIMGWGLGELDFAHFMTLYTTPLAGVRFCAILDNAHNLPLHLAVELGLPFALLICTLLLLWLLRNKPWSEQVPQRQLAWGLLAMVGLHSLLEYPLWYGPFQVTTVLALCILHSYRLQPSYRVITESEPNPPIVKSAEAGQGVRLSTALLGVAMLALVCSLLSWNYWRMSQLYTPAEKRAPAYRDDTFGKVQGTWFFSGHVDFAVLSVTPVTDQTASNILELGEQLLHFSPEAKVVEKILDAALILGGDDKLALYTPRFAAAFPEDYQRWREAHPEIKLP